MTITVVKCPRTDHPKVKMVDACKLFLLLFLGVAIDVDANVITKRRQEYHQQESFLGVEDPLNNADKVGDVIKAVASAFTFKNVNLLKSILEKPSIKSDLLLLRRSLEWILAFSSYIDRHIPNLEISEEEFNFLDFFFPELYATVEEKKSEETVDEVHITLLNEPNILYVSKQAENNEDCEEEKIKEIEKENEKVEKLNVTHMNTITRRSFEENHKNEEKTTTVAKMEESKSTTTNDFDSSVAIARFMDKLKNVQKNK